MCSQNTLNKAGDLGALENEQPVAPVRLAWPPVVGGRRSALVECLGSSANMAAARHCIPSTSLSPLQPPAGQWNSGQVGRRVAQQEGRARTTEDNAN